MSVFPRRLRFLSLVILCGMTLAARADVPEYYGYDERQARVDAQRAKCEELLVAMDPGPYKRALVPAMRRQAAAALLMLIFETPTLRNAAARPGVSDADLYNLFHFSGAFAIRPTASFPRALRRDKTGFSKIVIEPKLAKPFLYGPPRDSFLMQLRSAENQHGIRVVFRDLRERRVDYRETFADNLYAAMQRNWMKPAGMPNADGGNFVLRLERPLLPSTYGLLSQIQVKVALKTLTAQDVRAVDDIARMINPLHNGAEDPSLRGPTAETREIQRLRQVRDFFLYFFTARAEKFLAVRDEMMDIAVKTGNVRSALLEDSSGRAELLHEILDFAEYGDLTPTPQLAPAIEVLAPSETLKLPVPENPAKLRPETLQEVLAHSETPDADPMVVPRLALRAVDQALVALPKKESLVEVQKKMPPVAQFPERVGELIEYFEQHRGKAELDLANMEELEKSVRPLVEKTVGALADYPGYLERTETSAAKIIFRLDEANLVQMTMAQTLSTVTAQVEQQMQWNAGIHQLLALLRNYRQRQSLSANNDDLARQIITAVDQFVANETSVLSTNEKDGE